MKIKENASIQGLNIKMRPVLIWADKIWEEHGQELVITAGLDGAHSAGSLHYYGLALDLRTRYFDAETKHLVYAKLKSSLSRDYDVILHGSHIHVEYDPK
jgi:hypothetical protein